MSDEPKISDLAILMGARLIERVQSHPIATLASVAGVGYVLARGIPTPVLRLGASVALRAATARLMVELSPAGQAVITPDEPVSREGQPDSGERRAPSSRASAVS